MFSKIISNLILYSGTFLLFYYIRNYGITPDRTFVESYSVYIAAWLVSSILSRKFRNNENTRIYGVLYVYFIAFFLMLGALTVFIIKFHLSNFSHFVFYSSLILSFAVELVYLISLNRYEIHLGRIKFLFNNRALVIEFAIYAALLFYISVSRLDFKGLDDKYVLLILGLYLSWFIATLFGHQSQKINNRNDYLNFIWLYIRSYIIIISLNTTISFLLRLNHNDLIIVMQATAAYTSLSFMTVSLSYAKKRTNEVRENTQELKTIRLNKIINALPAGITFEDSFQYEYPQPETFSVSLNNQLRDVYLKKFPKVYNFLYDSINLCSFEVESSVIQRSNDIYNLEILPENALELFLNLRRINDLRRINCYLIEVNKKLKYGGIFVGKIETINLRYKRFLSSYPYYPARMLYFLDFIWRRVVPKLPCFKEIYFGLTRGSNRAISFAEALGRLYYCGFEIVNAKDIDNFVYFIAKKVRLPYTDPNPSYGLLFKMRRTGLNGKPIYVYKIRTMHPYAEYLQKFVYEKFSLQEGGKFNNDFRVTSWGRIFRKLWIDELPMIINFLKGELKLVGVRPLSSHYLNLYETALRERRTSYKPGLVPPFYVDMPKTLSEIMMSETNYLDSYDKHPVMTDIKYFFNAAYNIVVKRERSK
jgi:lipopolysaccharide/colanic/teichoic acid biosynthesis glycosyltransferase